MEDVKLSAQAAAGKSSLAGQVLKIILNNNDKGIRWGLSVISPKLSSGAISRLISANLSIQEICNLTKKQMEQLGIPAKDIVSLDMDAETKIKVKKNVEDMISAIEGLYKRNGKNGMRRELIEQ